MNCTRLWARARLVDCRHRPQTFSGAAGEHLACARRRTPPPPPRRYSSQQPAKENSPDDIAFESVFDKPSVIVRSGQKRNYFGLVVLGLIPATAFALGTWQVYRLQWKTDLIARFEDRLVRDPLPLPPSIDPSVIGEFDYRRITAVGRFRHDQEMLLGPRVREGTNGYLVITPLERDNGTTVLVCRGWISKEKKDQASRPDGLPRGDIMVEGLLREPWKKNMFTPDNRPGQGEFYFPDVAQMASHTGAQPVWIEETMTPDLLTAYDREAKGVPIGRPAEVNLRNNHTQYIFTWYSLSAATSVMMWMLLRKAPSKSSIRSSRAW